MTTIPPAIAARRGQSAVLALLLLVPAPSIGTFSGMILFPGSVTGTAIFVVSKLWLFILPATWYLLVEHGTISFSPSRRGGLAVGAMSGLLIGAIILAAYSVLGPRYLDHAALAHRVRYIGLLSLPAYVGGALYWIMVNSVLEEYVWRWFVVRQCEALFPRLAAVACAALFFTLHHGVALWALGGWPAALIGSTGVFLGGAVWSFLYTKYRSIWPGYLSHAIVDLCIFGLGAWIIWGHAPA